MSVYRFLKTRLSKNDTLREKAWPIKEAEELQALLFQVSAEWKTFSTFIYMGNE